MSEERWVVIVPRVHLGFIREDVCHGTVITYNSETQKLGVNGKFFESNKDLEILKKHGFVKVAVEGEKVEVKPVPRPRNAGKHDSDLNPKLPTMKVVESDEDLMKDSIDISHTKIKPKEAANKKEMEVIKADESPEERKKMPIIIQQTSEIEVIEKPAPARRPGRPRKVNT